MEITAEMVKKLRDATGVQMMVCKEALKEADGDMEEAKIILRKKGIDSGGQRAHKEAKSGIIYSYNHDNRVGVMLELRCETDFVAKNEEFHELAKLIAMHIAWAKPLAVDAGDLIAKSFEHAKMVVDEEEIAKSQVPEGKPDNIVEKIVEGKMNKFFERVCLLNQKEVQVYDGKMTIENIIKELSGKLTEKIEVARFSRIELGEDVEDSHT